MKKKLAIIVAICMIAAMLCVPAFAALLTEPDATPLGAVLRISTLTRGETTPVTYKEYYDFKDGWNEAMAIAQNDDYKAKGLDRVIIDLYADWKVEDGVYAPWIITVPDSARVTLNLNGHTIDRDRTRFAEDGEALYISDDTDVIINNGTITGGWSHGGAGAIHIKSDAKVTLNDVHIVNNISSYDGGGISLESGSVLTVNNGSFKGNIADWAKSFDDPAFYNCYGGAVYVESATAIFNNVEFKNNSAPRGDSYGAAIYGDNANIVIDKCNFVENGIKMENIASADSVIHGVNSKIKVTGSTFTNNGGNNPDQTDADEYSAVFKLDESELTINTCEFRNNLSDFIIRDEDESLISVSNTKFLNNSSAVMYGDSDTSPNSFFDKCTFDTNGSDTIASFYDILTALTFYNCSMGNSDFNNKKNIKFVSDTTEADRVLSVGALKTDGTTVKIADYLNFETGWNDAALLAADFIKMNANAYDRIVIDLYADVNTKEYGAITVPERARVTLNMNGHTIDRKRENTTYDGEVMCISQNADVIINDGSIKGGYSSDSAGGIHIKENATVVLNNVNVVGNVANGSDGAGIAVYDGSVLVMNGGSISDNKLLYAPIYRYPYGALYVDNATATLNNVTIKSNRSESVNSEGVAIYAEYSTVTLNDCAVSGNGTKELGEYAESIIAGYSSTINISNTDFTGNGAISDTDDFDYSHLFYLEDTTLTMTGGKITGNAADKLFYFEDSKADINGVTITGNDSVVLDVENDSKKVTLTECVLGNNSPIKYDVDIIVDEEGTLVLNNCDLGDTTFDDEDMVTGVGSIFGEGSVAMIIALFSLIASGVCIFLTVYYNKKKLVPAIADNAADTEDEK